MPWWAVALRLTGLGWWVGVSIAGGVFAGVYLDGWIGTKVVFTVVGILLGTIVAFYGVYQMVKPFLIGASGSESGPRRK